MTTPDDAHAGGATPALELAVLNHVGADDFSEPHSEHFELHFHAKLTGTADGTDSPRELLRV